MSGTTRSQYLETKVLTASQPRLQLMLLEAAVRHCRAAQRAGSDDFWGEFNAAIGKAMDIVEELVNSVCGQKTDISEQLEEQYAFLFRELAACRFSMEMEKLVSCIKLLDYECETWKLACEKLESQTTTRPPVILPHMGSDVTFAGEGFSLEA